MEDAGVDLPSCAGFETVGAGMEKNSVVALVPFFQAAADICFRGTRLEAHVGVGEIVLDLVVLRRKVIGLGLSLLSDELGEGVALVHVVGDGAHVVKKLAEQIPSLLTLHYVGAEQQVSGSLDRFFEQELFPGFGPDITEALVGQGVGPLDAFVVEENQRSLMPPRWPPKAYRSSGWSLSLRPGIMNDRGTQQGSSLRMPLPASMISLSWDLLRIDWFCLS